MFSKVKTLNPRAEATAESTTSSTEEEDEDQEGDAAFTVSRLSVSEFSVL